MKEKVFVITGPTGVGKTEVSLEVAKRINGEIINCDASQFKKELNIGTAKIVLSNIAVPHHLIDIIDATSNYSIYDFQKIARNLITEINNKGKVPILVGGSGLYINACVYDYDLADTIKSNDNYDDLNNDDLYDLLLSLDPNTTIHKNNRRRVERAIELIKSGRTVKENYSFESIYDLKGVVLNCPRDLLYERINERVIKMISSGLLDEINGLIAKGIDLSKINEIGYKEFIPYFNNEASIDEAIEEIKKNSRHLAKRQITWFKHKMNFPFIDINYNDYDETINKVLEIFNK